MKFLYIIINYKNTKVTIDAVESIRRTNSNYFIIIIDNDSEIATIDILKNEFLDDHYVNIYPVFKNLSYSRAINYSFDLVRANHDPDFVVVMNSDIVIKTNNFDEKINLLYSETKFHLLGPSVFSLKSVNDQNPDNLELLSLLMILIKIIKSLALLILTIFNIDHFFLNILTSKKKHLQRQSKTIHDSNKTPLHGSILIFSRKYFELFDYVPVSNFFYMEEDLLFKIINEYNLVSIYSNEILVHHTEDASIDFVLSDSYKKRVFIRYNVLFSLINYFKFSLTYKKLMRRGIK